MMRRTVLTLALMAGLAGCDREAAKAPATLPEPKAAPSPVAAPATQEPVPPALPPETTTAIDEALTRVQAFNAGAASELAAIARAQARITAAAGRAYAAAEKGDAATVTAARREAETAHAGLLARATAFQTAQAAQTDGLNAGLAACGLAPPPADPAAAPKAAPAPAAAAAATGAEPEAPPAYPNCAALAAEGPILAKAFADISARLAMADAAWLSDRPRLDEAGAMIALR